MQITGAQPIQNKNSKWYTPRGMFNGTVEGIIHKSITIPSGTSWYIST
jgi:hypothetical protein